MQDAIRPLYVRVVPIIVFAADTVNTDTNRSVEHPTRLQHLHLFLDTALDALVSKVSLTQVPVLGVDRPVVALLVQDDGVGLRLVQPRYAAGETLNRRCECLGTHVVAVCDLILLEVHVAPADHRLIPPACERSQFGQAFGRDLLVGTTVVVKQVVE